ncbi:hypothetical protein E2C01_080894 [Portunus trituberculatus]|uniref:Uncharacterized protein n=1 Tax=Portunus trituberculatus TaxID=210409 RepID=A0A5B7IKT9_PORTR|nr:hypothetical protein [Portunus trituberculatus]
MSDACLAESRGGGIAVEVGGKHVQEIRRCESKGCPTGSSKEGLRKRRVVWQILGGKLTEGRSAMEMRRRGEREGWEEHGGRKASLTLDTSWLSVQVTQVVSLACAR